MQRLGISQNAQYTYKYNTKLGRHGWLRLTPAYSVQLVEEILKELGYTPECVFEPFSGTGTTELVCANKGITSFAYEINPFLTWFGNVKLDVYSEETIYEFLEAKEKILNGISKSKKAPHPPIHNIERWWNKPQLDFLSKLKCLISKVEKSQVKDLLLVAFCRVVIDLSNASFNHVSTSFVDGSENVYEEGMGEARFSAACDMIADTARCNPLANAEVYNRDSKQLLSLDIMGSFDTVITSPPYPNRISYIRELRPYMYWLDYLKTSDDASGLDWKTIGGTWGKATSLLASWKDKNHLLPDYLYGIADEISKADNKSSLLMANYVLKYFNDMRDHLEAVYESIRSGGRVFYIIGNSNFYGITVPAEQIYIDMMEKIGFVQAEYRIVRKRNCNKKLYEYVVMAKKT